MPTDLHDFDQLTTELERYLDKLSESERNKLALYLGRKIRKSQSQRITKQQNPDGTAYAPRRKGLRERSGHIRRKMFQKLKTIKHLNVEREANGVSIGFNSRISHIARIHQDGLVDRVYITEHQAIRVRYAQRTLLGFTDAEIEMTADEVRQHILEK